PLPRREAHRTALEKLLEFSHDAEDADALVLIDVVEIAHGDDPFGRDGLVIDLDPWRDAGLSELGGRLGTYADELRQAFVWGGGRFRVLRGDRREHVIDLLGQRVGELGIGDQVRREPVRDRLSEGRDTIKEALIFSLGRHGAIPLPAGSMGQWAGLKGSGLVRPTGRLAEGRTGAP